MIVQWEKYSVWEFDRIVTIHNALVYFHIWIIRPVRLVFVNIFKNGQTNKSSSFSLLLHRNDMRNKSQSRRIMSIHTWESVLVFNDSASLNVWAGMNHQVRNNRIVEMHEELVLLCFWVCSDSFKNCELLLLRNELREKSFLFRVDLSNVIVFHERFFLKRKLYESARDRN